MLHNSPHLLAADAQRKTHDIYQVPLHHAHLLQGHATCPGQQQAQLCSASLPMHNPCTNERALVCAIAPVDAGTIMVAN